MLHESSTYVKLLAPAKFPRLTIGTSPFRMLSGNQRAGAAPTQQCRAAVQLQGKPDGSARYAEHVNRYVRNGQPCRPAPRDRGRTRFQGVVICSWPSDVPTLFSLAQIRPTMIKTPISIMRSVAVAAEMRQKSPSDRCMI